MELVGRWKWWNGMEWNGGPGVTGGNLVAAGKGERGGRGPGATAAGGSAVWRQWRQRGHRRAGGQAAMPETARLLVVLWRGGVNGLGQWRMGGAAGTGDGGDAPMDAPPADWRKRR